MKKLLSQKTAELITEMINKEYLPGEQIPNETDLVNKFQVSRTTIREAIRFLCSKNVLEVRRGSGTFVCDNPGLLDDPFGLKYLDTSDLTVDLFEMALLIEPDFAYLAAKKASRERIEQMEQEYLEFARNIERYQENGDVSTSLLKQQDANFHKLIIECSENKIMSRIFPIIAEAMAIPITWFDESLDSSYKCHKLIINAIKDKDAVLAKHYMKLHVTELVKTAFSKGNPLFDDKDSL